MIVLSTKKKRRWISHRTHRTHALHDGRRTHAIMSSTTWGGQCFVASCRLGHRRSTVRPPHPPTWHNPRRRWGHVEMATGTYPSGIGHPYPYPLELSFTRWVTRTRRVIYIRRVTCTRKAYPRITYKYRIFIWKIIHFKLKLEWVWSRIWRRVQQYIY